MSFITGAIGFILGLALIIAIHEFGHYYVARLANVKIFSFSIGFGRPLCRWIRGRDRTRYVIAAIPLGGYVSMMGATEDLVEKGEEDRAFCRKPLWIRSLIVLAGPAANFVLAIILLSATYVIGFQEIKPVVGDVAQPSIAMSAGIKSNDQIIAVNGTQTKKWVDVNFLIVQGILDQQPIRLQILRDGQPIETTVSIPTEALDREESMLSVLGVAPYTLQLPPIVGKVITGSSADEAGLQARDKILTFNQIPINNWQELVRQLVANPGATVNLEIQRADTIINLPVTLGSVTEGGRQVGRIGVAPYIDRETFGEHSQYVSYGLLTALVKGTQETVRMTQLTLSFLWRMVNGDLSLKNISGPVTIAEVTGSSFNISIIAYLITLSLISISIGILNLLPIPMLDGGHLLYYAIEFVKRSPLSETAKSIGQRVGVGLLALLIMLALYNDFNRLFFN